MTPLPALCAFISMMVAAPLSARIEFGGGTVISFATIDEATKILTSRDDFVRRMSPFDRAARMKTDKDVSEREYIQFVGKNVLEWNDSEKRKITAAFLGISDTLENLSLPFPENVLIIKTTGKEEGGAAYTRGNAIVFPKDHLKSSKEKIQKELCHELFHILSRANPELREKLYAVIGFVKCSEVTFPAELRNRKITNPDAPKNDHCIHVTFKGEMSWGIPILYSSLEKYDMERGGEFFDYLTFKMLLVERDERSFTVKPIYDDEKPKLVGIQQVSGFYEQVGRNTGYIIHPEEILADNFAHLVMGNRELPSPEIIKRLEEVLKDNNAVYAD